MSPTIHRERGFKFNFFSNENSEPPHIHIRKGNYDAKYWLYKSKNCVAEYVYNDTPAMTRAVESILEIQKETFIEEYNKKINK